MKYPVRSRISRPLQIPLFTSEKMHVMIEAAIRDESSFYGEIAFILDGRAISMRLAR